MSGCFQTCPNISFFAAYFLLQNIQITIKNSIKPSKVGSRKETDEICATNALDAAFSLPFGAAGLGGGKGVGSLDGGEDWNDGKAMGVEAKFEKFAPVLSED